MADEEGTETEPAEQKVPALPSKGWGQNQNADGAESADAASEDAPASGDSDLDPEIPKLRKEAAKYRTDLRKAEKELADAKAASLSDTERAIAEAKASGAAEATAAMATRLVAAELRGALVPAEVIEDLNLAKFLGDDGEIDADAITAAGKKYAPAKGGAVDLKQGVRGSNGPSLEQQIADAKKAGDVMAVIRLENSRLQPAG